MSVFGNDNRKDASGERRTEGVGAKLNRMLRKNASEEQGMREAIERRRRKTFYKHAPKHAPQDRAGVLPGDSTEPESAEILSSKRFPGPFGIKPKKSRESAGSSHSTKAKREQRVSRAFLLPSITGVALFFVLPFFVVIYYSVIDNPVRHNFVGFSNYVKVFNNSAFRLASWNSLKFSLVSVPLAVSLALLLAVVMEQKLPWKSRFRSFFLSPMMVPTASVIMIWQILFHYNGLVNSSFGNLFGGKIDWLKSDFAQVPIILLFLWKNLGYNMILFMSGLSNIPKDQIEVARLESATEFQIFWLIKIRYLSSTILFVTIMSLINSFKVFREVYLMGGDYPYDALYMLQHFMNNTFRSLDYQKLSAAAVMMAIFLVIVIGALFLAENWFGKDLE